MGYYHITLCPVSRKICTIVLPKGKFEYQKLPMELCNSPDIFQKKIKMDEVFNGLECLRAYIDDLLIISNGNFEAHLNKVKIFLKTSKAAGLKINAEKAFFVRDNLKYLGFEITRQGIMPKGQAIKHIAIPTYKKQLRSIIGRCKS